MSQVPIVTQPAPELPLPGEAGRSGVIAPPWGKIALLVLLVVAIYWSSLMRLWSKTNPIYGEANWGHSFIVPLIGLYYLYLNREALFRAAVVPVLPGIPRGFQLWSSLTLLAMGAGARFVVGPAFAGSMKPYVEAGGYALLALGGLVLLLNWGVGSLLFGLLTFGYGIWPGQNDYLKDVGLIITIFGIVLTLCGWQVMKIAWFPIVFLICAIPWPGLVYSWVAGPLQQLAATVAVFVLNLTGVDAVQIGTKIDIPNAMPLEVAEACAGLRSLMTFITIGGAVGFLSNRPLWQRLFITASAVPIAVFCNAMRVSTIGLLNVYVNPDLARGEAHIYIGMLMLIPALFLLLGVGWMLDQLFVEEVDAKAVRQTGGQVLRKASNNAALAKPVPAASVAAGGDAPRRRNLEGGA